MGRAPPVDAAGHLYHVLNRANRRATIFQNDADYEAFECILVEAVEPFQADEHFLKVCRYVERNATIAKLCARPEDWRSGSLHRWKFGSSKAKSLLTAWPIPRRSDWCGWVAKSLSDREISQLGSSIQRGSPFGDQAWSESIARKYDLEMTMRPHGRPKKLGGSTEQTA